MTTNPTPRGRGTCKTAVIGAVERSGKVVAEVADELSGKGVRRIMDPLRDSTFRALCRWRGVHTNTIEGVWSRHITLPGNVPNID